MQRGEKRVSDQTFVVGQDRRQLVAPPVELHAEMPDVRHGGDHTGQRRVTPLLDDLDGFGRSTGHQMPPVSTVKAPWAVATGSSIDPVNATPRTKATDRVIR